ncbi:MAG TPA: hypothetical protein VHG33_04735 [Woeseiaceae bacterium]|nr:hypothetical protein [Woeseiaceae bacterium]
MSSFLFKWLTIAFAGVLLSSMVSMVGAFFGWMGNELRDLLLLQALLVPVAIAAAVSSVVVLTRRYGHRHVFKTLWAGLPGWLVFFVVLSLSLVLIAELSFILVQRHTGDIRPLAEHIPAAAAFFSSIALAACYVVLRLEEEGAGPPDAN